jgi:hypothetical protein
MTAETIFANGPHLRLLELFDSETELFWLIESELLLYDIRVHRTNSKMIGPAARNV